MKILSQEAKIVHALPAVANAFAGTVDTHTNAIDTGLYPKLTFLYHKAVGATGTATITVQACSAAANGASDAAAIPFRYAINTTGDTFGALTTATTAGFTTTAGSNQIYAIEVDARDCPLNATTKKPFVFLQSVEVVASAVLGGVIAVLHEARDSRDAMPTSLT